MVSLFSLRLAFGMLACLPFLPATLIHPRFYRTHMLTALGLACVALGFAWERASVPLATCLVVAIVFAFMGTVLWRVEGARGGQATIVLTLLALGASVWYLEDLTGSSSISILLGDVTSAAVLGTAMSAMLLGHSYLIAPGMALAPLMRLLAAIVIAVMVRMAMDGYAFWSWRSEHSLASVGNDTLLWLPVRWLIGFVLPLVLTWMAYQSARIRSTQSATGILYVVVIFCFLGELTGLLLRNATGLAM